MKSAKCSKLVQKLNIFLIIKFLQQYFIYDYFMRLFELVIEELNMLATSQYQPRLSSITNVAPADQPIRL